MLKNVYNDLKSDIYTVATIDEVGPDELTTYGVIKVLQSDSIIVSGFLARNAFSDNYRPEFGLTLKPDDLTRSEFFEISYKDVDIESDATDWLPMANWRINTAGTPVTYSQSWSISSTTSGSASVRFATMIGINPEQSDSLSFSTSIGGSISCTVNPQSSMQMQLKTDSFLISNVMQRRVTISTSSFWSGYRKKVQFEDWEVLDTYTVLSRKGTQTSCKIIPLERQLDGETDLELGYDSDQEQMADPESDNELENIVDDDQLVEEDHDGMFEEDYSDEDEEAGDEIEDQIEDGITDEPTEESTVIATE